MKNNKDIILRKLGLEYAEIKSFALYRNPREFSTFFYEKINPNHIFLVYGKLKKKYRKGAKYIRVGRIVLSLSLLIALPIDFINNIILPCFYSFLLIDLYFIMCKMESLIKCLSVLKVDWEQGKLLLQ